AQPARGEDRHQHPSAAQDLEPRAPACAAARHRHVQESESAAGRGHRDQRRTRGGARRRGESGRRADSADRDEEGLRRELRPAGRGGRAEHAPGFAHDADAGIRRSRTGGDAAGAGGCSIAEAGLIAAEGRAAEQGRARAGGRPAASEGHAVVAVKREQIRTRGGQRKTGGGSRRTSEAHMNKKFLSGLAFSLVLSAAPAFADDVKVEAGASTDPDIASHEAEADVGKSTTETKIKHHKHKTTIKSTTEHSGVKAKSDSDDDSGASAEAKAKVKTDE